MRPGKPSRIAGLLACAGCAAALIPAHAAAAPVRATLGMAGANASGDTTTILTLTGIGSVSSKMTIAVDPAAGELVIREPAQLASPGDPCTPAAGTPTAEVRCPAGSIGAIVGNLGGGNDRLVTAADVNVFIGAFVESVIRPLRGGEGRDLLVGGARGDTLFGSASADEIRGRGGADFIDGGRGRDRLFGGAVGDILFGGAGIDRISGGPGRDLCAGGKGRDRGRGCFETASIP